MPISLNISENTVNYVTNFFLSDDPGSEDSPSILGYAFRSLLLGLLVSGLICLLGAVAHALLQVLMTSYDSTFGIYYGVVLNHIIMQIFAAAAGSTLISFLLTPIFLAVLRYRDQKNLETSGLTLTLISMGISTISFLIILCVSALL